MQQTAWIDTARRMCLGVFAMLIGVELVTGLLLGLLYEPSRMPAATPDGRPTTMLMGERVERVGPAEHIVADVRENLGLRFTLA